MPWGIDIGGILKHPLNHPRIIRRITCAWLLLVVVGSLQPHRLLEVAGIMRRSRLHVAFGSVQPARVPVAAGSWQPASPGPVVNLHRQIHWLAFGGAAFLLLLGSRKRRQEIRSVAAAFLLGLSLEYLQHLIYRNPMEWYDVRDDGFAILVALALYRLAGSNSISPTNSSPAAPAPALLTKAGTALDEPAGS
jgi:hypothetical protein